MEQTSNIGKKICGCLTYLDSECGASCSGKNCLT